MRHVFIIVCIVTIGMCGTLTHAFDSEADRIADLQTQIDTAGAHWTAGTTWVSLLSPAERRMLMGNPSIVDRVLRGDLDPTPPLTASNPSPDSRAQFDWRNHNGANWITPVRNQWTCGSCVAFAAIGAFEAQLRISSGLPDYTIDLSEQHLFSCGGGSCTGGWQIDAAFTRCQNVGVPDEACLPYRHVDDNCADACSNWQSRAWRIQDWESLGGWFWPPSVQEIKTALNQGPIACSMIVYSDFMDYTGGVYQHVSGGIEGGHAVLIVGYEDANGCWIVKNSWGKNWGEDGFFRIVYEDSDIGQDSSRMIITQIPPSPTPAPTSTPVATRTPPPTATPAQSATPAFTSTPAPTATPAVPQIGITINAMSFSAGDPFLVMVHLDNPGTPMNGQLFVILDIQGQYWFWPSWTDRIEWAEVNVSGSGRTDWTILDFTWPDLEASILGAAFWTTFVSEGSLPAGYDTAPFKFEP